MECGIRVQLIYSRPGKPELHIFSSSGHGFGNKGDEHPPEPVPFWAILGHDADYLARKIMGRRLDKLARTGAGLMPCARSVGMEGEKRTMPLDKIICGTPWYSSVITRSRGLPRPFETCANQYGSGQIAASF